MMVLLLIFLEVQKERSDTLEVDRWFGFDKVHHFFYSLSITGLSFHALHCEMGMDYRTSRDIAISTSLTLGLIKEIYDYKRKGLFSLKDIVYDAAGTLTGYLIFIRYGEEEDREVK